MATNPLSNLSIQQLKQAIAIKEKIDTLQKQLDRILGGQAVVPATSTPVKKRTMSAAVRAKISAAQMARYAKKKGATKSAKPAGKAKPNLTAAARAKMAAAARRRWVEYRAKRGK